ncbi:HAMP domain-containing sensor histidine kinase [Chitinophaga sp. sic0106]|uniref:sensor histidine kinase n=1 Tax=Chitinophaga sp. sic0106 TaxID=2854785 RepID=UPI001C484169|nr:HAMP domain-containing sensor histidine kinase [Chitinophaga sp. sic0106]MBV7530588.1 HAMP domain-containing histidine kinase [Chitinophaga sp. sic0106]
MKIRHRLSLQFTLISGIILTTVFVIIYLLSARFVRNNFYKQLEGRALLTAEVYLEKDELTKKKFLEIEKSYQQGIPGEASNIYDSNNHAVFIEQAKYDWPASLLNNIRKHHTYRFSFRDKYGLGIYYPDNQGDFVVIVTARNATGEQQLSYLLWSLVIMGLIALAVTYGMSQWYASRALRPIQHINREVKKIRATSLHQRLQRGSNKDEIDELAHHFNELLAHMENAFEMQRSFVSNASHELRTPLTTIIGEIEVTMQKLRSPEEYQQTLETLLGESEKLRIITDGLLQLTRVDEVPDASQLENILLDEMLEALRISWSHQAPAQELILKLPATVSPAQLTLSGNPQLLAVAINNILKNGFKFSGNAPVTATLETTAEGLLLSVTDTGIGIPEAEQERIFMPLYRASNAHAYTGYGIGLAMTRKILQLHRARITVSSVPTQGTTFHIWFSNLTSF